MKTIMKWIVAILCVVSLVACGPRNEHISLEKDGAKYTIGKDVTFYYPNGYNLDTSKNVESHASQTKDIVNTNTLYFIDDEETIFYSSIEDSTDNTKEEKEVLYSAKLEQEGATNIVVSKPILESGVTVEEITATYVSNGTRSKHIVYFAPTRTYVYGYLATTNDYNDNIEFITEFLKSIVIDESVAS